MSRETNWKLYDDYENDVNHQFSSQWIEADTGSVVTHIKTPGLCKATRQQGKQLKWETEQGCIQTDWLFTHFINNMSVLSLIFHKIRTSEGQRVLDFSDLTHLSVPFPIIDMTQPNLYHICTLTQHSSSTLTAFSVCMTWLLCATVISLHAANETNPMSIESTLHYHHQTPDQSLIRL